MSDESISKAIISRCKFGVIALTILDVVSILVFVVTLTVNIFAVIITGLLVVGITSLIMLFKKVQKNPLKYRKFFFNFKDEAMAIEKNGEFSITK